MSTFAQFLTPSIAALHARAGRVHPGTPIRPIGGWSREVAPGASSGARSDAHRVTDFARARRTDPSGDGRGKRARELLQGHVRRTQSPSGVARARGSDPSGDGRVKRARELLRSAMRRAPLAVRVSRVHRTGPSGDGWGGGPGNFYSSRTRLPHTGCGAPHLGNTKPRDAQRVAGLRASWLEGPQSRPSTLRCASIQSPWALSPR